MKNVNNSYLGSELGLFAKAINWKRYWNSKINMFIRGTRILEVGVGIGTTTEILCEQGQTREIWLGLEPDHELFISLNKKKEEGHFPNYCTFRNGTLKSLQENELFDTILYIDVLEHIDDDIAEINHAATHINHRGTIVVLAPAYQILFSEFDKEIGHFRRYNRKMLEDLTPEGFTIIKLFYLDSVGLLISLANRLILHSPLPTYRQIEFWDNVIVKLSRLLDPLFYFSCGRSVIIVWQRIE